MISPLSSLISQKKLFQTKPIKFDPLVSHHSGQLADDVSRQTSTLFNKC